MSITEQERANDIAAMDNQFAVNPAVILHRDELDFGSGIITRPGALSGSEPAATDDGRPMKLPKLLVCAAAHGATAASTRAAVRQGRRDTTPLRFNSIGSETRRGTRVPLGLQRCDDQTRRRRRTIEPTTPRPASMSA